MNQTSIGYVRVSTEEQATEGVSLDAQRAKLVAWCEANDSVLVEIFADEGISGSRVENRPGLQAALDAACTHQAVLVTYSLSRLARSTRDTLAIAERLERAGADLASLSERIDTTTAAGKMVFRMLAVLAEFERDQVSERTCMALAYKRSQRRRYTNIAPFGYRWCGDSIVSIEQERELVERMAQRRSEGWSYQRIADEIAQFDVPTRTGVAWGWGSVRSILTNKMREAEATS